MGSTTESRRFVQLSVFLLTLAISIFGAVLYSGRPVQANPTPTPSEHSISLGNANPGSLYALSLNVKDPAQLQGKDAIRVTVKDAQGTIESKWLHSVDLDFYLTLRPRTAAQ
jgi:hypothetical protein